MGDEPEAKVKVVDRRWFTSDGDLKDPRASDPPPVDPPGPAQVPPAPPPVDRAEPHTEAKAPAAVGFLDLVDFLAQQAAALLSGQIPGRGRDPETARFFIDLLGVVQDKSAGQMSSEEASYIEDVLYQLRSLFVAATR